MGSASSSSRYCSTRACCGLPASGIRATTCSAGHSQGLDWGRGPCLHCPLPIQKAQPLVPQNPNSSILESRNVMAQRSRTTPFPKLLEIKSRPAERGILVLQPPYLSSLEPSKLFPEGQVGVWAPCCQTSRGAWMLKTKLSLIFTCWQHIHILFKQWALIPSQLLFAASAVGSELLNRSKARGDVAFCRVLGCRPYSVCEVPGYLGSCPWASWESVALAVLTRFQEAGPPAALASLGNLGPVCGDSAWGLGPACA